MISSARIECQDHSPLRDEHPDHAILSRCDKEFAVTAPADVEIRARDLRPHRLVDKFLQRHVYALPALIFYIELNFFDWSHSLRNAVVGFLHSGKIACEDTPGKDIAEDELAAKLRNMAIVSEPIGDRPSFVVIIHGNRVGETVLHPSV